MIILDGKKLSEKILENLKKKIRQENLKLSLVVVLVGENQASLVYIKQKEKKAKELGVSFRLKKFRGGISAEEFKKEINNIILQRPNGIIIQLPLPPHLRRSQAEILNLIPPEMDVDVLSRGSRGRIGQKNAFLPPTVEGILRLLKRYKINLKEKKIVVVGKGFLVGKPLIKYLEGRNLDVESADEFTKDLKSITLKADILVTGVGKQGLITEDMVKNGVAVIDAGISKVKDKFQGDADFETISKKASYITPVPGGVGPMTVAMIFENLAKLAVVRPK